MVGVGALGVVHEVHAQVAGADLAQFRAAGAAASRIGGCQAGRFWARRLASAARSRNAGEGGTHPACLAMPRSSRLAQCSVISPSRVRNQWVWVMANAFPVGGMAASTVAVSG